MTTEPYLLAIDQGTTSTRAIVFDRAGVPVATSQQQFEQYYPNPGWVEHDPEQIWETTLAVCREVLRKCESMAGEVVAIGITNQRETTVVWDRDTGTAVGNAIVWQDRRTADECDRLRRAGHEQTITTHTGLLLDPYFSATKLGWILDHTPGARSLADQGRLAFGTTDCFLIWRLTDGRVHATDATNASRTSLFDIHAQDWSDPLLDVFAVPRAMLPDVYDSAADFGATDPRWFGRAIPICGVAGDQQAATVGQACFAPGMVKSTYGTGCFMVMNTGDRPLASRSRLLTTVAYRLEGKPTFALEGSIFNAGTAIQWLRDELGLMGSARDSEALAEALDSNRGVYLVPAFTGLGAPHWDPHARGAVFGLTRDTGRAELVRAALEAVCYQTHDLIEAMRGDGANPEALRVDGGMVVNDWLLQFLADIIDLRVERPTIVETTALGAAYLAGLQAGVLSSLDEIADRWQLDRVFQPSTRPQRRETCLAGWAGAIRKLGAQA